tara:strand:- start:82 stop:360 length:279 start_codon:yes stop_codon:yes gene_type:complete
MKMTLTNTQGILYLAKNSEGRNRSVHLVEFATTLDPSGTHLLAMCFPHNDIEMRTLWLCKMKDTDEPQEIWLDVDFHALEECTTKVEVPDED